MTESAIHPVAGLRPTMTERLLLGMTPGEYVRSLMTPWDALFALILVVGIPCIVLRFVFGLGAVTNLSQATPWGLWIGFDMLCGVALAAGGFTLAAAVYVFGLKDYKAVVRPAILTGLLGYIFAVIGLLCDLGQPWRVIYPIVYQYGTTSVMFEVGWCVFLYTTVLMLEFIPAFFEWMGWPVLRRFTDKFHMGAIVLGILLSTLHQSSLGSLFLMAPDKIHPLWYSPYIPLFFFVSAVIAGLAMVTCESALSHRIFKDRAGNVLSHDAMDRITIGLGRGCALVLFAYFFLKLQGLVGASRWDLLATPMGTWFLVEILGFVLLPCAAMAWGARSGNASLVRLTAGWVVIGVIVNRINISLVAYGWDQPQRYFPSWMEVAASLAIVTMGILCFRWIVNRMPVLSPDPRFDDAH